MSYVYVIGAIVHSIIAFGFIGLYANYRRQKSQKEQALAVVASLTYRLTELPDDEYRTMSPLHLGKAFVSRVYGLREREGFWILSEECLPDRFKMINGQMTSWHPDPLYPE